MLRGPHIQSPPLTGQPVSVRPRSSWTRPACTVYGPGTRPLCTGHPSFGTGESSWESCGISSSAPPFSAHPLERPENQRENRTVKIHDCTFWDTISISLTQGTCTSVQHSTQFVLLNYALHCVPYNFCGIASKIILFNKISRYTVCKNARCFAVSYVRGTISLRFTNLAKTWRYSVCHELFIQKCTPFLFLVNAETSLTTDSQPPEPEALQLDL